MFWSAHLHALCTPAWIFYLAVGMPCSKDTQPSSMHLVHNGHCFVQLKKLGETFCKQAMHPNRATVVSYLELLGAWCLTRVEREGKMCSLTKISKKRACDHRHVSDGTSFMECMLTVATTIVETREGWFQQFCASLSSVAVGVPCRHLQSLGDHETGCTTIGIPFEALGSHSNSQEESQEMQQVKINQVCNVPLPLLT